MKMCALRDVTLVFWQRRSCGRPSFRCAMAANKCRTFAGMRWAAGRRDEPPGARCGHVHRGSARGARSRLDLGRSRWFFFYFRLHLTPIRFIFPNQNYHIYPPTILQLFTYVTFSTLKLLSANNINHIDLFIASNEVSQFEILTYIFFDKIK